MINPFYTLECDCNDSGLKSCHGWNKCECKAGYVGVTCAECALGYYKVGKKCFRKYSFKSKTVSKFVL